MTTTSRRSFLKASAIAAATLPVIGLMGTAHAADIQELTQENWDAALASGRPIAIRFYETWCPNCTAQGKTLAGLLESEERFADYIVLEAPFGANREFAQQFGLNRRTSIAIVSDGAFVDSIIGATRPGPIAELLDMGLSE